MMFKSNDILKKQTALKVMKTSSTFLGTTFSFQGEILLTLLVAVKGKCLVDHIRVSAFWFHAFQGDFGL